MADMQKFQRHVASVMLDVLAGAGFALAGSGAIREHGLTRRPTMDIDLFTTSQNSDEFHQALDRAIIALKGHGFSSVIVREAELYARLIVLDEEEHGVEIDLATDYRAENPIVIVGLGPVLTINDAVANKLAALFSRGEVRDFLDLDSIRLSGRFSDAELIRLAAENDPGFSLDMFISQLDRLAHIAASRVEPYGIGKDEFVKLQRRLASWADALRNSGE